MDAKQFLKEKGISNNDFMDSGVADLIEKLLTEYQALQLQQTGVSWRSEQLVSFLQWYIKDDMVREKKELIKSVVERYLKETNCH